MNQNTRKFILDEAVEKFGDSSALTTDNFSITYREYFQLVIKTEKKLRESGAGQGDRLAILSPNCLEYVILLMALMRSGIIAAPVNTRYPERQVLSLLNSIACNSIVLSPKYKGGFYTRPDFFKDGSFRKPKTFDLDDLVNLDPCLSKPTKPGEFSGPAKRKGQAGVSHGGIRFIRPDRDATILFTSGSSAKPKAVLHSIDNHYYSALGANKNVPFKPGDRWLLSLPLCHAGGFGVIVRAAVSGGSVVIPEPNLPLHDAIKKYAITHVSLVSTQLYRLLQDIDVLKLAAGLKAIVLGGSAFDHSLIKKAVNYGLPVHSSYGSTEMASQITTTRSGDSPKRLYTSGRLLKYRKVRIAPDGEILVKGNTLFKGYVEGEQVIPQVDSNGWFKTGDLGNIDEDGYLTVRGRKDTLFISGGENIQPEEIELLLCTSEDVVGAVVVPVPDEEFGARPVAFVKVNQNKAFDRKSLYEFLKNNLPKFMIPNAVFPWPDAIEDSGIKPDRDFFTRLAEEMVS